MTDIVRRLACSQARGWRQASLVNELLEGPVTKHRFNTPTTPSYTTYQVGDTRVGWSSFVNLRERLVAVGFIVFDDPRGRIVMRFPEVGTPNTLLFDDIRDEVFPTCAACHHRFLVHDQFGCTKPACGCSHQGGA